MAAAPSVCVYGNDWPAAAGRTPAAVTAYLDSLNQDRFDLRAACARWARSTSNRRYTTTPAGPTSKRVAARFILFAAPGIRRRQFVEWLSRTGYVRHTEETRNFVVAGFSKYTPTRRLLQILYAPQVQ